LTTLQRLLAAGAAIGVLVAGCAAASHLRALQPAHPPASPPLSVPSYPSYPAGLIQRGIDIDAYTYSGQDVAAAAHRDISYITSLHANAVLISFPFFVNGQNGSRVYATTATPAPDQVAVIVRDAQRAGLRVSLRPLLDEASIGRVRRSWAPVNAATWFGSYQRFLIPYAEMADRLHVPDFIVGTELSRFSESPYWATLDAALRMHYHGTLGCVDNWDASHGAGNCGPGTQQLIDAYRPLRPPLASPWESYDRTLPPGTVEAEVGIAAAPDAFQKPYVTHWPITRLDTSVQARWFSAACHAAAAEHLGGIYFWSIGLSTRISGPTSADQGNWADGAGARAISACFAGLERSAQ
jgi:hypothetical protein